MLTVTLILLIIALGCFFLGAINKPSGITINLTALGLFFFTLASLLNHLKL